MTTAAIPIKYAEVAISGELLKNAPATNAISGIFAPQGIKPVVITVILLSRSCSMVRDAIIPGTPQPVATSIGIKDLPERPSLRKILSIIKAMRDIYPQSSSKDKRVKRMSI